jgi:malate synthase
MVWFRNGSGRRRSNGAVAIFNLMEDAATAEISRAQLWFWLHRRAKLEGGLEFGRELYARWKAEELAPLEKAMPAAPVAGPLSRLGRLTARYSP